MDMLSMNDGTNEYVSNLRDFYELADRYMSFDASRWLEAVLSEELEAAAYAEELEKEMDGLKEHHKEVLLSIRKHSERLAELIHEKELNRRKLSNTAGAVGVITGRELSR